MFYFLFIMVLGYTIFTYMFAYACYKENVRRAWIMGLAQAVLMTLGLGLYTLAWTMGLLSSTITQTAQFIVAVVGALFTIFLFLPTGRRPSSLLGTAGLKEGVGEKFNQKNTAFNLAHVGGYGAEAGRRRWSLLKRDPFGGQFWRMTMSLRPQVDGDVNPEGKAYRDRQIATKDIKEQAKYLGADIVGITTVKDDFVYSEGFSYEESKVETGPAVTTPVNLKHKIHHRLWERDGFSENRCHRHGAE